MNKKSTQSISGDSTSFEDNSVALIVDLDGTLISTDTLLESVLMLFHKAPWLILLLPIWLIRGGRAGLKYEISNRISLDATTLPYRHDVIDVIRGARKNGRQIVLATAANKKVATNVAMHLGVFDHIIASTKERNAKAGNKLKEIQEYLAGKEFDYIGDSKADLPIWKASRKIYAVSPNKSTGKLLEKLNNVNFIDEHKTLKFKTILRSIRIHQWAKNILLFAPLVLSQQYSNIESISSSIISFLAFGVCASATYLWNDLLDLPSDRQHSNKKMRPLAAGDMSIIQGVSLSLVLFVVGFLLSALYLPTQFTIMLLGYIALTISYTFYFKRKLMTDVLMLGGLYAYRILIGAAAINVIVSPWLLAFSIFFFLSLALVKRFTDLSGLNENNKDKVGGRGYYVSDLDMVRSLGTSASYISVLVMALYVSSPAVANLYPSPNWLWLLSIIFLYWLSRIWFLAGRNQMPDDPVLFAVKDKVSYMVGISVLTVLLLASF